MGFWDDFIGDYAPSPRTKTFTDWYRLPDGWLRDGALVPERREALLRHLYGDSWRLGNGDGSKYLVLNLDERLLTADEVAQRQWLATRENCYAVDPSGTVSSVKPEELAN